MKSFWLVLAGLMFTGPGWAQRPPTQQTPLPPMQRQWQQQELPPIQQAMPPAATPPAATPPAATQGRSLLGVNPPGANLLGQNPVGQNPVGQNPVGANSLGQNTQAPPVAPPPAPVDRSAVWLPAGIVKLQALDKVNAQTTALTIKVGQSATFGSLTILVKACVVRPTDQPADAAAFLAVVDNHPDTAGFDGWMLANEPSASMMQNPVYDLRVTGCT
jgi:hypothetical protein